MAQKETKERNIDVWLLLVIVVIVLAFGGGMWITGKTLDARVDELITRMASQSSAVQSELFELRKQSQETHEWARQAASCADALAAAKEALPAK